MNPDPDPEQVEISRKVQILGGLFISLFTILLFLGALEFVAYLWERNTAQGDLGWTLVASRRMPLEQRGDEDFPIFMFEANKDYLYEGIHVHINSLGFRDEEVEFSKSPDTYRILNVGDSVVFGWEVKLEDSYGKQLEAMLNANDDGREYEVLNIGVPGWNIESARSFMEQEGLQYDPDLVILDITVVNDVFAQGPSKDGGSSDFFSWLRDKTHAWPFLTTQARFLLSRQVGPEAIPVLNPPKNASAYYPLQEDSATWDSFWAPVQSIKDLLDAEGIPLLVVAFPTAFQVNSSNHPDLPQQILANRSTKNNIDYIDLLPIYEEACLEAGMSACEGYENLLFADVWMHPNSLGHEMAAQAIHKWQLEQKTCTSLPIS